jgi:hypothetical protein
MFELLSGKYKWDRIRKGIKTFVRGCEIYEKASRELVNTVKPHIRNKIKINKFFNEVFLKIRS